MPRSTTHTVASSSRGIGRSSSALWLGNVSVRRHDLIRIGISSKGYAGFWHSDTDLGLRLQAGGLRGTFDRRLLASHRLGRSNEAFLRDATERGRSAWLLEQEHGERFDSARTVPMLDGLGTPVRQVVSFLGRGDRAGWSSRALMQAGVGIERAGFTAASTRLAQLARRVRVVESYRRAEAEAEAEAADLSRVAQSRQPEPAPDLIGPLSAGNRVPPGT